MEVCGSLNASDDVDETHKEDSKTIARRADATAVQKYMRELTRATVWVHAFQVDGVGSPSPPRNDIDTSVTADVNHAATYRVNRHSYIDV